MLFIVVVDFIYGKLAASYDLAQGGLSVLYTNICVKYMLMVIELMDHANGRDL